MENTICIPIHESTYREIRDFLDSKKIDRSVTSVIHQFIEYARDNAEWKTDIFFPEYKEKPVAGEGYYWKHRDFPKPLFLPSGTELKMEYNGRDHFAAIVGGQLKYNGRAFHNPSQLAAHIAGGTSRSAPRDMYLKRPDDTAWLNAGDAIRKINLIS